MEALKKSISAYRSHFTRTINSAGRLMPFAKANPSPTAVKDLLVLVDDLRTYHAAIMQRYIELECITVDPAAQTDQDTAMKEVETRYLNGLAEIQSALKIVDVPPPPPVGAAPQATPAPGTFRSRRRSSQTS
jgi:hypothetical protein